MTTKKMNLLRQRALDEKIAHGKHPQTFTAELRAFVRRESLDAFCDQCLVYIHRQPWPQLVKQVLHENLGFKREKGICTGCSEYKTVWHHVKEESKCERAAD